MLEKAIETTHYKQYATFQHARIAIDLLALLDSGARDRWSVPALKQRLRAEFERLSVEINDEKSRIVDLRKKERF